MNSPQNTDHLEGIAVVGMAVRFPGASDIEKFWKNLCDGVESVTTFTDEQLLSAGVEASLLNAPNYVKTGVLLDGLELFDAKFFGFTPREAEITDPQHRIFLECAWEALENAGYDPDRTQQRIGVFAGAGINLYFASNLVSNPDLLKSLNDLQKMIAIDKDYLATRVAYKLNLKGPALTIQTACSSSLVAVHIACQSLLNGECDMALAGGVSLRIPQMAGYLHEEGSIASPDGHCRAFDAAARGTIFGSGSGIVILKRLDDAERDMDRIHAVIKGSAINNDGAAKIGYTAPSVDGQAAVISEAQAVAGITAEKVTYIETHGTGTLMGDPIEVAALTKAFRRTTQDKGFCAIGSVKTNVGHLDAAAGVAGLIKTVLALENGMLPPSLNFQEPNPAIDFANSPFYVQRALSAWQPRNGRRVAGVSAFGIGGTNVHVVVEEPPSAVSSDPSRPWQLLTISAHTPTALEKATSRLSEYLQKYPSICLADVTFTLQQRRAFPYRRSVAAESTDDALRILQTPNNKRVHTGRIIEEGASAAFMFPGQGAQYVNMARDLYDDQPVFREHVDRCLEHLRALFSLDLKRLIYPDDSNADAASEQLRQTGFTQPAMFTIEYALAQLWISWGIVPAAMVGHSLGEYVAATISGVFDLKDALMLVAERGRLMQELPPGSMLAVHMTEKELQSWLKGDISLAAVNAPSLSVVSGPIESIKRLENEFTTAGIEFQELQTSHAFHSAMMEPMISVFIEKVDQVRRNPPRIPFLSCLTGTWITAREAGDPCYWGAQIRNGVRFSPAVEELLKAPGYILLEVGPGNTLSTLARQHLKKETQGKVVTSLRHPREIRSDRDCMLSALGRLWDSGLNVDWNQLYTGERRRSVPLPSYPFERKRYWIDARVINTQRVSDADSDESASQSFHDSASRNISRSEDISFEEGLGSTSTGVSSFSRLDLKTGYVAPQTQTEKALAKLWQDLLGVREVGIHDDFFELGGESLLAVNLVTQVERLFGQHLPLASFIKSPTIHQFAQLITASQPPSWASLVKIQSGGSKPPLFLMHSHGGNVLEYYPLAHHLVGKNRPVYALQARGLDGTIPEKLCVEEMASYYLSEIRSVQPHGPYYLGGFCFGGFLALEAAQQLKSMNETVDLLIMINTCTKLYPAYRPTTTAAHRILYSLAYRLVLEYSNISSKPFRKKVLHVITRIRRFADLVGARVEALRSHLPGSLNDPRCFSVTFQLERLALAHDRAWLAYNPAPYDGRVLLLKAQRQPFGIVTDPTLGWSSLLKGDVQICETPGLRQNMLDESHVSILAIRLNDALDGLQQSAKLRRSA